LPRKSPNPTSSSTVDQEFLAATLDFIERAHKANKPFLAWFNPTRMHIWTRLKPESQGKTGLGVYPDGMVEHDGQVGQLLKKLDDLDIADNTIVIYTTDNGAETFTWPDGGTTPFRGEKNTNWEGGYRVPSRCVQRRRKRLEWLTEADVASFSRMIHGAAPGDRGLGHRLQHGKAALLARL
jgi:arylsulfatase A-like enzyme